jgi:hypothetical protein
MSTSDINIVARDHWNACDGLPGINVSRLPGELGQGAILLVQPVSIYVSLSSQYIYFVTSFL